MNNIKKLNMHKLLSVLVFVVGVILLIYMITVEDEPGALPLLLIIIGAGWYLLLEPNFGLFKISLKP